MGVRVANTLFPRPVDAPGMPDPVDYRDDLADALEERGWTVVDTFGELEDRPSVVVGVEDLAIAGETVERADVTLRVRKVDVSADRVEVSDDECDLSAAQRETLDDVCDEKLSGPEITVWEYEPGSHEDGVDDVVAAVREIFEEAVR